MRCSHLKVQVTHSDYINYCFLKNLLHWSIILPVFEWVIKRFLHVNKYFQQSLNFQVYKMLLMFSGVNSETALINRVFHVLLQAQSKFVDWTCLEFIAWQNTCFVLPEKGRFKNLLFYNTSKEHLILLIDTTFLLWKQENLIGINVVLISCIFTNILSHNYFISVNDADIRYTSS